MGRTAILPNTFSTEVSLQIPYCQQDEEENYAPDRKGNDASEIFQLRDYVPGDPVKQIHWKLSSKLNHILIKEASLPVSRSLLVFWDKNTEEASPDEMDAMAESVSSICQALSQDGVQYTLGWTDGQEICQEEAFTLEELLRLLPQMLKTGRIQWKMEFLSGWMLMAGRNMERSFILQRGFRRVWRNFPVERSPFCSAMGFLRITGGIPWYTMHRLVQRIFRWWCCR